MALLFARFMLGAGWRVLVQRRDPHHTAVVATRRFIESMGATFIKFGQYLAIRRDLFSQAACAELSRLYSNVQPMPYARVAKLLEAELGAGWQRHFAEFGNAPVASASIAQIHRATLANGDVVAVKIQRPEVEPTLRVDIAMLTFVARIADRLHVLGAIRASDLIDEVADFTLAECDFEREGATAERMRLDAVPGVRIPGVHWATTTKRILTMDYVDGYTLLELCLAAERGDCESFSAMLGGFDAEQAVERLAHACFHQIFITGRFHGDPHPANIMIDRAGQMWLIDFGIFSELAPDLRERFAYYVWHVARGEIASAVQDLCQLVRPGADSNYRRYRAEAGAMMQSWFNASVERRDAYSTRLAAAYQGRMFDIMRRNHISMPREQLLFWRALGQVDATAHRLPIAFDLLASMRAFFTAQSATLGPSYRRSVIDAADYSQDLVTAQLLGQLADWISATASGDRCVGAANGESGKTTTARGRATFGIVMLLVGTSALVPLAAVIMTRSTPIVAGMAAAAITVLMLFGLRFGSAHGRY